jgi:hypothetical protein
MRAGSAPLSVVSHGHLARAAQLAGREAPRLRPSQRSRHAAATSARVVSGRAALARRRERDRFTKLVVDRPRARF